MSTIARERGRLEPLLHAEADGDFNGSLQSMAVRLGADAELVRLCLNVGGRQGRWDITWSPVDQVQLRGKRP